MLSIEISTIFCEMYEKIFLDTYLLTYIHLDSVHEWRDDSRPYAPQTRGNFYHRHLVIVTAI